MYRRVPCQQIANIHAADAFEHQVIDLRVMICHHERMEWSANLWTARLCRRTHSSA